MNRARELLTLGMRNTREIAERVGLADEGYLRRLFKRQYGVSMSEYLRIDHELTLYHNKP